MICHGLPYIVVIEISKGSMYYAANETNARSIFSASQLYSAQKGNHDQPMSSRGIPHDMSVRGRNGGLRVRADWNRKMAYQCEEKNPQKIKYFRHLHTQSVRCLICFFTHLNFPVILIKKFLTILYSIRKGEPALCMPHPGKTVHSFHFGSHRLLRILEINFTASRSSGICFKKRNPLPC